MVIFSKCAWIFWQYIENIYTLLIFKFDICTFFLTINEGSKALIEIMIQYDHPYMPVYKFIELKFDRLIFISTEPHSGGMWTLNMMPQRTLPFASPL